MADTNIIINIANNLLPVERLITATAYLLGIFFAMKALFSLKSYGEARTMMSSHSSLKEPMAYFLVSAMLLFFPTGLAALLNTTFGSSNILQYAPIDSQNKALSILFGSDSVVGRSLVIIIQVIGLIAFVRGWVLIARSSGQGQPGSLGKGITHVFGGILAMNIVLSLQIINNTLYGTG